MSMPCHLEFRRKFHHHAPSHDAFIEIEALNIKDDVLPVLAKMYDVFLQKHFAKMLVLRCQVKNNVEFLSVRISHFPISGYSKSIIELNGNIFRLSVFPMTYQAIKNKNHIFKMSEIKENGLLLKRLTDIKTDIFVEIDHHYDAKNSLIDSIQASHFLLAKLFLAQQNHDEISHYLGNPAKEKQTFKTDDIDNLINIRQEKALEACLQSSIDVYAF